MNKVAVALRRAEQLAGVRDALNRGREADAIALIASLEPDFAALGAILAARALRKLRRNAEALSLLREVRTRPGPPGPAEFHVELIDLLLQDRSAEAVREALAIADEGLAGQPGDRGLLLWKLHAQARLRLFDDVRSTIDLVPRSEWTGSDEVAASAALKALTQRNPALGLEAARRFASDMPESGDLLRRVGEAEQATGDLASALATLEQAVALLREGGIQRATRAAVERIRADLKLPPAPKPAPAMPPIRTRPFLVAAMTNVYNERFNLPIWLNHYGRQVGIENCIILDNGSDDGSTESLGKASRVPMPRREKYNEQHRMQFVSDMANNLLNYYDAVLYSDCDELVVADPAKYADLTEYAGRMTTEVAFSIGLNVRQNIREEYSIDLSRPVLAQRSYVQFVSPMCKPLLIKDRISWGGGFHTCQHMPRFDDLYLFHLRHADLAQALSRLETTRGIEFAREGGGRHHRRDDVDLALNLFVKTHLMKVLPDFNFEEPLTKHLAGVEYMASGRYAVVRRENSPHLYRIPDRFRYVF